MLFVGAFLGPAARAARLFIRQPPRRHAHEVDCGFDRPGQAPYEPAKLRTHGIAMKVRNSLKSLRGRHRDNKIVRRKGRVYVINKVDPRYKAKQG